MTKENIVGEGNKKSSPTLCKIGGLWLEELQVLREDLFNFDFFLLIAKICVKLKDPSTRLHQLEVTLLSPFRPQLADRVSLAR